jgi:hypothetical protein
MDAETQADILRMADEKIHEAERWKLLKEKVPHA